MPKSNQFLFLEQWIIFTDFKIWSIATLFNKKGDIPCTSLLTTNVSSFRVLLKGNEFHVENWAISFRWKFFNKREAFFSINFAVRGWFDLRKAYSSLCHMQHIFRTHSASAAKTKTRKRNSQLFDVLPHKHFNTSDLENEFITKMYEEIFYGNKIQDSEEKKQVYKLSYILLYTTQ